MNEYDGCMEPQGHFGLTTKIMRVAYLKLNSLPSQLWILLESKEDWSWFIPSPLACRADLWMQAVSQWLNCEYIDDKQDALSTADVGQPSLGILMVALSRANPWYPQKEWKTKDFQNCEYGIVKRTLKLV